MIPHCPENILQLPPLGQAATAFSCGSGSDEGFRAMLLMPSMLWPILIVLFGGLCLLNQYRRRKSGTDLPTNN